MSLVGIFFFYIFNFIVAVSARKEFFALLATNLAACLLMRASSKLFHMFFGHLIFFAYKYKCFVSNFFEYLIVVVP
jgi:hypothetical protein